MNEPTCEGSVGPEEPLYCDACGKLMPREDLKDSQCPTLCIDCCVRIDRDYEDRRDDLYWPGWFGEE
jgi:hypothetical protein